MSEEKLNSSNFPLENQQTPYLQVFLYYLHFIQGSNPQHQAPLQNSARYLFKSVSFFFSNSSHSIAIHECSPNLKFHNHTSFKKF